MSSGKKKRKPKPSRFSETGLLIDASLSLSFFSPFSLFSLSLHHCARIVNYSSFFSHHTPTTPNCTMAEKLLMKGIPGSFQGEREFSAPIVFPQCCPVHNAIIICHDCPSCLPTEKCCSLLSLSLVIGSSRSNRKSSLCKCASLYCPARPRL